MIPFERQFQTFHSLQNYFLLNELLAPGYRDAGGRHRPAPRGAGRFRPAVRRAAVFFIRAATPQVLLDEVDRVL